MYFACWQRVPSWSFLSLPLLPMYVHQAKSSAPNQRGTGRSPPVVQPGHTETLPTCGEQLHEAQALQAPCPLASPLPCPRPGAHCQGNRGGEAGGDSKGRVGRKQTVPCSASQMGIWRADQGLGQAWTPITSHCQDSSSDELWTRQKRDVRPYDFLLQTQARSSLQGGSSIPPAHQ